MFDPPVAAEMSHAVRLAAIALPLALLVAAPAQAAEHGCPQASGPRSERALRLELRCLVNSERESRGLPALAPNGALARAAGRHARHMVRKRFFSHFSSKGSPAKRAAAAGYLSGARRWSVGENLAWLGEHDAGEVVRRWLHSRAHRGLLLSRRFHEFGIGVVMASPVDRHAGLTVVVNFGERLLRRPRRVALWRIR